MESGTDERTHARMFGRPSVCRSIDRRWYGLLALFRPKTAHPAALLQASVLRDRGEEECRSRLRWMDWTPKESNRPSTHVMYVGKGGIEASTPATLLFPPTSLVALFSLLVV